MPIYEYICTSCGQETEIIQRFTDPPLETCPACSGALEKKISPSTFHLKGSGWYVTDYARKSSAANGNGGGNGEKTEKSETASSEKSTASETTPAPKADKTETKTAPASSE